MKWLVTDPGSERTRRNYLAWLARAGIEGDVIGSDEGVPADARACAALLLTGGGDVDPVLYGEPKDSRTADIDARRDALEIGLIRAFLGFKLPVFGVCRGIQILNVALGGKLIQHVPDYLAHHSSAEIHSQVEGRDSWHALQPDLNTPFGRALQGVEQVNSSHHQAVLPSGLASSLRVAARSAAGIIEAVEGAALAAPVYAVQWHPERVPPEHPASTRLLELWKQTCFI